MTLDNFPKHSVVCGSIYIPPASLKFFSTEKILAGGHMITELQQFHKHLLGLPWWTRRTARSEYFMSDKPRQYSYGNKGTGTEVYEAAEFTPEVVEVMDSLNLLLETNLNVCFFNKYDNEKQHLGWHADQFPGMIESEPIVVLSFGVEREIWLQKKGGNQCPECLVAPFAVDTPWGYKLAAGCGTCGGTSLAQGNVQNNQRVKLQDGSAFIMPPGYQNTHLHRIPKHDRPCGWRISLTFRSFE